MPFYVADYLADTAHLSTVEHGAYLLLIMTYWRQGALPDDDSRLARIARMSGEEWASVRSTIVELFGDGWTHKRIDSELARAEEKSLKATAAGRLSADARNKGNNPTSVQRPFNERSTDVPTECQLSQPQSQPLELRDAIASPVPAKAVTPESLKLERGRLKLIEMRARIHLLGNDWNSLAADCGLRQIDDVEPGGKRERSLMARLREGRDFPKIFTKIRASKVLRGDNKSGWRVHFDWILISHNIVKILEGNYDDEDRKVPAQSFVYSGQQR